jgi:nucleoside-diphosphate-sugar epimerase
MKTAFVTGGCGFVGRHLVRELVKRGYSLWIVDDLSTGIHPHKWLGAGWVRNEFDIETLCYANGRQLIYFSHVDIVLYLYALGDLKRKLEQMTFPYLGDIFHLASVVGGRAKIEGDPMSVAIDLAIDAAVFRWIIKNRVYIHRVLYPSSSAAYPVHLQTKKKTLALKEEFISFDENLGQPDMTYGWSKLSGEYLARIAASNYDIHTACVRPFSGYGGDQDLSYPTPAIARRAVLHEDPLVVWGTGEQGRDFIHIDDCIEAMLLALDNISDGSGVNIGSGTLTTFKQLAQLFVDLEGYSPQIKPLIDKPMGVHSRFADITNMQRILKWSPRISLREGMQRVLEEQRRAALQEKVGSEEGQ